jgi:hypothetical protein
VRGEAEHVPVDQLPPTLLLHDVILVHLHVTAEVVLQHPHENHGEEGREEEDEHKRVDDGEPVDLQGGKERGKEGGRKVFGKKGGKGWQTTEKQKRQRIRAATAES